MSLDRTATVAEIVTEHPAAARVFQGHGIDYCCRGDVTVPVACLSRRLDPAAVFAELEAVLPAGGSPADDPRALATPALIARIVDRHHGYLRRTLPYLDGLAEKVARVHGGKDARLAELRAVVGELAAALGPHLEEEETVLFPTLSARQPDAAAVRRQLAGMHADHLAVGTLLGRARALTEDFALPAWACNTYRVFMAELEGLEADTLTHVHLENHVLAPRFAT